MTKYDAAMDRDANRVTLAAPLPFLVKKTMTFSGDTENDPGDFDGTGNPATLFTVTGDVLCLVFGICKTTLVGAATIEVGVVDSTSGLLQQVADASTITANTTYDTNGGLGLVGKFDAQGYSFYVIGGGQDIIQTIGTDNITEGVIDYYCFWRPLSSDGNVVAA